MKYLIPAIFCIFLFAWSFPIQEVVIKEIEVEKEVVVFNDATAPFEEMFEIVSQIETGGDKDAIGDNGESFGIVQIQKAAVEDVNNYWHTSFSHKDAFDVSKSRKIFQLYLTMLMHKKGIQTTEQLVRCWNGGPNGHKRKATLNYWNKYQKQKN